MKSRGLPLVRKIRVSLASERSALLGGLTRLAGLVQRCSAPGAVVQPSGSDDAVRDAPRAP